MEAMAESILLESVSHQAYPCPHFEDGKMISVEEECCQRLEFHIVDLKKNQLARDCFPPLIDALLPSSSQKLTVAGHTVYLLGGVEPSTPELESDIKMLEQAGEFYTGASRLHFSHDRLIEMLKGVTRHPKCPRWTPMAPARGKWYPLCTSLNNVLYNFGDDGVFQPEVFNPSTDAWEPLFSLPAELVGRKMSAPLLADPAKLQILVHFPKKGREPACIYAFHPHMGSISHGTWKRLPGKAPHWVGVGPIVDNVIFFHCRGKQLLKAHDTLSGKPLEVQWSKPPLVGETDMRKLNLKVKALFGLANGRLICMAANTAKFEESESYETSGKSVTTKIVFEESANTAKFEESESYDTSGKSVTTKIVFLKFRAQRDGETVNLSPYPSQHFELPRTVHVHSFVPLSLAQRRPLSLAQRSFAPLSLGALTGSA